MRFTFPAMMMAAFVFFSSPAGAADITECDRVASDPRDRGRVAEGADLKILMNDTTLAACARDAAANPDVPRLAYQHGRVMLLHAKGEEGKAELERAAEAGYLAAQLLLTSGYASGAYFQADQDRATFWAEKAAAQGSKYAQATYGTWLIEGKGTPKNVDKGLGLLRGYAEDGNAFADFSLAVLHRQGDLVKRDIPKAVAHYEKARDAGLGAAFSALALMYIAGDDIKRDVLKAQKILNDGAEAGHNGVQLLLARYLAEQVLPSPDGEAEARKWMCRAGPRGAQLHLEIYREDLTCN